MNKAVVISSQTRQEQFISEFEKRGWEVDVLDFKLNSWFAYDYSQCKAVVYYPHFCFSSSHPLSLDNVKTNLQFIASNYPHLKIYPDPKLFHFYNDKYRQFLLLQNEGIAHPETIPLYSEECVELACQNFGFPIIVKNRFGAGGATVFKCKSKNEVMQLFHLAEGNFCNAGFFKKFFPRILDREFLYSIFKIKKAHYPFFSSPLLAQRFYEISRDLKLVYCGEKLIEGHWRYPVNPDMWKVNIDGGGVGAWEYINREAIELGGQVAQALKASWLNIDLLETKRGYLVSEFSPVWHHYYFKEKENFIYKDDYNIPGDLKEALLLEKLIVSNIHQALND